MKERCFESIPQTNKLYLMGYRKCLLVCKLFEFEAKRIPVIRNKAANIFSPKITCITANADKKIKCSMYICGAVFQSNRWFQLNSFLSFVIFCFESTKEEQKKVTTKQLNVARCAIW